jgi:hypothetical protein
VNIKKPPDSPFPQGTVQFSFTKTFQGFFWPKHLGELGGRLIFFFVKEHENQATTPFGSTKKIQSFFS